MTDRLTLNAAALDIDVNAVIAAGESMIFRALDAMTIARKNLTDIARNRSGDESVANQHNAAMFVEWLNADIAKLRAAFFNLTGRYPAM